MIYNYQSNLYQLQADLRKLEQWEHLRNMEFHPAKCEYIRFSRKRNKSTPATYLLHSEEIPQVRSIKYLGVKMQGDLKSKSHLEYITTKASSYSRRR